MAQDGTGQETLEIREETFEIFISEPAGGKTRLEARSHFLDQPAYTSISIPSTLEWKDRLVKLQAALLFNAKVSSESEPVTRDGSILDNTETADLNKRSASVKLPFASKMIKEVGRDLFDLLFAREIYSAYAKCRADADNNQVSLKVRLSFNSAGLSYLPWEALHDGDNHLALSPKTSVVRNSRFDQDVTLPFIKLPIAVLGMVPKAKGLNVEAEQANIVKALKPLLDAKNAQLRWASGSPTNLIECLRHPPPDAHSWHVFHFSGHGGFDAQEGKGYILVDADPSPIGLEGRYDTEATLYSDNLKYALEYSDGLRLVFLNSCRGAMGGTGSASAAEELVTRGFSAVIAMQFDISDDAAILFSAYLYQFLAGGELIHKAVTLARQQMKFRGCPEWVTPVLYMRSRDGKLFRH
jgi:hypothetical protein